MSWFQIAIAGQAVDVLGPEGIFGELALITKEPRSATARARTNCRIVEIPERRFLFLTQETAFRARGDARAHRSLASPRPAPVAP